MSLLHFWFAIFLAFATIGVHAETLKTSSEAVPLLIGQRTIHTFRAPLGLFSASERAEGARRRIEARFEQAGEGWPSLKTTEQGIQIDLDGQPMFFVVPGDASALAGETAEELANSAVRTLRIAWKEHQERRDPRASLDAFLKVALATALLALLLTVTIKLSQKLRMTAISKLSVWVSSAAFFHFSTTVLRTLPSVAQRCVQVLTWLLGMFLVFVYSTYSFGQFAVTRPASERLTQSILNLGIETLTAIAGSLPGIFVAAGIFLAVWIVTRITGELFDNVESRSADGAWLNTHTAPATRRIVNASLWLFAGDVPSSVEGCAGGGNDYAAFLAWEETGRIAAMKAGICL